MYSYRPRGICARQIDVELDGSTIRSVAFKGGCDGNLKAVGKLVAGQDAHQVIELLRGNRCGMKPTSCADQMTYALEEALAEQSVKD